MGHTPVKCQRSAGLTVHGAKDCCYLHVLLCLVIPFLKISAIVNLGDCFANAAVDGGIIHRRSI